MPPAQKSAMPTLSEIRPVGSWGPTRSRACGQPDGDVRILRKNHNKSGRHTAKRRKRGSIPARLIGEHRVDENGQAVGDDSYFFKNPQARLAAPLKILSAENVSG